MPTEPAPSRLRVAVDATPLLGRPTGVGAFCSGALGGLGSRGDVAVSAFAVSWRRRRGLGGLVPPGVSVVDRPMPARPLHLAWRHARVPPLEWFTGPADVVHGTNFVVPPTARAAAVVSVYDLTTVRFPELREPATAAFPDLIRRALRRGAFVHTLARFVADEVVEVFGADPDRVRVVAPGVPETPADDPAAPPALRLPPGCDRYVLAVGTVEPRKDYPGLVAAFDAVAADRPELALVVVGADGWGADAFTAALSRAKAAGRVVRAGYLSDGELGRVLRRASVLCYPSRYEGFGFPPLQAMAVGVPVVATAAGAVPEVVGPAAALVAVGDTDALAGALAGVLDDAGRRDALVAAGYRQVAGFSWDACAAGLTALYAEAADR